MLQIGFMSLCPAHHSCYCLNNIVSITAKKKWDIFRIKSLQYGTVHIPLQKCSMCLVPCVRKVAVHLGCGTVRVWACIDARGHHFLHLS
jgi:hypothetical protein